MPSKCLLFSLFWHKQQCWPRGKEMSRNRETCLTHGTEPGQRNYNFKEPPCKNDSVRAVLPVGCVVFITCEATSNLSHVQKGTGALFFFKQI